MTRPRVPPDQRIRTAQACESCKRRKQKCNGLCPCNTCSKRNFLCEYPDRQHVPSPSGSSSLKRKHDDEESVSPRNIDNTLSRQHGDYISKRAVQASEPGTPLKRTQFDSDTPERSEKAAKGLYRSDHTLSHLARRLGENGTAITSRATSHSGDEEALIFPQNRMLQDPTGRLLYIGDSGTLSYLQMIRMVVERVSGQSPFTTDPRRHKIVESALSLPASYRPTHLLPDQTTARVLADAFFVNTQGLVQVFDRDSFFHEIDLCYKNPLASQAQWLCLLNLVFAIGLLLATPRAGTPESFVIENLRNEAVDPSEMFYQNAKSLNDPLNGIEDADFWSVQALLLMSLYTLSKSKRNAAFALLGMAVRSGYSLGLHREETLTIFPPREQALRRSLWKSLFVIDRFLSSSLGRPTAIAEEECSGRTLKPPDLADSERYKNTTGFSATFNHISNQSLEAAVRSCSAIGNILRRVYQHRMISTRLAQELADVCQIWPEALAPILQCNQAPAASPSQGMAILHINLFHCHSIILFTRPFFLSIMNDKIIAMLRNNNGTTTTGTAARHVKMVKFMEACVLASTNTVTLVQHAYEAGYLPRRDPFVITFLFTAVLNLLANEYTRLYTHTVAQHIQQSIVIMEYCAETDPQASRLLYIMTTFRDVVQQQQERGALNGKAITSNPQMSSGAFGTPNIPVLKEPFGTNDQLQQSPTVLVDRGPPSAPLSFVHPNFSAASGAPTTVGSMMSSPQQYTLHGRTQSASTLPSIANLTTPNLASATPATAFPPVGAGVASSNEGIYPSMVDLSALDGAMRLAAMDIPSIPDEKIEFDALWPWATPGMGATRYQEPNMVHPANGSMPGGLQQPVNDGMVPLYGVVDD